MNPQDVLFYNWLKSSLIFAVNMANVLTLGDLKTDPKNIGIRKS